MKSFYCIFLLVSSLMIFSVDDFSACMDSPVREEDPYAKPYLKKTRLIKAIYKQIIVLHLKLFYPIDFLVHPLKVCNDICHISLLRRFVILFTFFCHNRILVLMFRFINYGLIRRVSYCEEHLRIHIS